MYVWMYRSPRHVSIATRRYCEEKKKRKKNYAGNATPETVFHQPPTEPGKTPRAGSETKPLGHHLTHTHPPPQPREGRENPSASAPLAMAKKGGQVEGRHWLVFGPSWRCLNAPTCVISRTYQRHEDKGDGRGDRSFRSASKYRDLVVTVPPAADPLPSHPPGSRAGD